jgi:hypothetical protein
MTWEAALEHARQRASTTGKVVIMYMDGYTTWGMTDYEPNWECPTDPSTVKYVLPGGELCIDIEVEEFSQNISGALTKMRTKEPLTEAEHKAYERLQKKMSE